VAQVVEPEALDLGARLSAVVKAVRIWPQARAADRLKGARRLSL
jgi:hypothetical protein